jgi:hypothetical protein
MSGTHQAASNSVYMMAHSVPAAPRPDQAARRDARPDGKPSGEIIETPIISKGG